MSDNKINAVLFDFGETIFTFGKIHRTKLFKDAALLTYNYLKDLGQPVADFKKYCFHNLTALRLRYFLFSIMGRDFDSLELLKKVNTRYGISLNDEQWQNLIWLWYKPLADFAYCEPDIVDTLTKLKNAGLKLGIISNTFINACVLEKHLESNGILRFFKVKLYSYEFPFRKPDPRIFRAAAARIDTLPENILYVGDRIKNDIKPALKLNMHAALKNAHTNTRKKVPPAAWKIDLLSQLPELIQKHNLNS